MRSTCHAAFINKWLQRIRQADPADVMALRSRSRARHTLPASIASQPAVVQRILEIRVKPPENLQRVPGPEAILYYLHRDPALTHAGARLPCCIGYLDHPFKNKPVETEKEILSLLANTGWSV